MLGMRFSSYFMPLSRRSLDTVLLAASRRNHCVSWCWDSLRIAVPCARHHTCLDREVLGPSSKVAG